MSAEFTPDEAVSVMALSMPGCVRGLGITVDELGEGRASLRMPANEMSCREGEIFAGQALATLADTAMCFAVWSDGRGRRPIATVDLHVTFLRGGGKEDLLAHAEVIRSGKTLAFCRVSMVLAHSGKEIATAVATFSLPA
ncbi:MAG: PaaI family thioesterase [Comamonadaceae bacterium]|nr:MAG: PaaI family thioesterase [Comamonadaceae bacterium]